MPRRIRVLVVDDSAFMRKALTRMLSSDPMVVVADTASDGEDGFRKAKALAPDVVTLDIRMPGTDGLVALKKIMSECPVPVVMLSSLTSEGGEYTLRALDYGAVDFIDKSSVHTSMDILGIADELIQKVKTAAGIDIAKMAKAGYRPPSGLSAPTPAFAVRQAHPVRCDFDLVVIGASTGGPPALQSIICSLPYDFPAGILVVQHMPIGFTASLADRLNTLAAIEVAEAFDGDPIRPGKCLIAPSGLHMGVTRKNGPLEVGLSEEPEGCLHRPSVDVLMKSVAENVGRRAVGVLLTGMGYDGAMGMKTLREAGAHTIAQDEASCVVYGMPKAAVEAGGAEISLSLGGISEALLETHRLCL